MARRDIVRKEGRGRASMVDNGDGIDYFGNQNQNRNEIKELKEQVVTLYDKVRRLQRVTKQKDSIPLEICYGAPHWRRANLVRFEYASVNNVDNELPKFCGNPLEFIGWLKTIESVFKYCYVTEEKKVKLVSTCLKGKGRALGW
ncbi:hypothetical protein RHMOL_Rhmol10G0186200 [Rhododendron molle]|uniref:Uncharacterized protein n=1 Tax=Rhododendron molle TaxID=49168 RepID=A0ACC0M4U2_RHOML|nr:hypothetical protein RHMOL_Rhmol10G0186200 [Rhododendron molle]